MIERFYMVDESVDGLVVFGEVASYVDTDGRRVPAEPDADVSELELRSMPGGAVALARWRAHDDEGYQAFVDELVRQSRLDDEARRRPRLTAV